MARRKLPPPFSRDDRVKVAIHFVRKWVGLLGTVEKCKTAPAGNWRVFVRLDAGNEIVEMNPDYLELAEKAKAVSKGK